MCIRDRKKPWRYKGLRGVKRVGGVRPLCAMTLLLHGVGPTDDEQEPPLVTEDALRNEPKDHAAVVLTNPPFGKKSSITVVNEESDTCLSYTSDPAEQRSSGERGGGRRPQPREKSGEGGGRCGGGRKGAAGGPPGRRG